MTYLLSWASIGTDVLVGLCDPADASRGRHLVPGCVERTGASGRYSGSPFRAVAGSNSSMPTA